MLERPSDYTWYIQAYYAGSGARAIYKGNDVQAAKTAANSIRTHEKIVMVKSYYHGRLVQTLEVKS